MSPAPGLAAAAAASVGGTLDGRRGNQATLNTSAMDLMPVYFIVSHQWTIMGQSRKQAL